MPSQIPTLEDDSPVITDQPILSKTSGDESLGSAFQDIGSKAATLGISMEETASKSGLYMAQAQTQNLKDSARSLIKMNPSMADNINQQTQQNSNIILQNAVVNKEDRAQLGKDIATSMGDLSVDATDAQVRSNNADQALAFINSFPATQKSYATALQTDPDLAESQAKSFYATLQGLGERGVFKPFEIANFMKPMNTIHDNMQNLMANRDNITTAAQYHAANYNPITNDPTDLNGTPYNQNQVQMAAHAVDDISYRGLLQKSLQPGYQFNASDTAAWAQLPPAKAQQILDSQAGAAQAYGNITANNGWQTVSNDYNNLKSSGKLLTDQQKARFSYYKNYINGLQNGKYLDLQSNTAAGANISQDFHTKMQSIQNDSSIDPSDKQDWIDDATNRYITSMGELGRGMPPQFVQPIPQNIISPIQSSFVLGGDAQEAVNEINRLSPQNQTYLKTALKTPAQQSIAFSIGRMGDNVDPIFSQDLINFNQKGYNFNDLKSDDKEWQDKTLDFKIASNPEMSKVLRYMNLQDNGSQISSAFPGTIKNYVKGKSQSNGDFGLDNADDVLKDAINNVKKGYDLTTGKNYIFDNNDLALTDHEYGMLGDYAVDQAKQAYISRGYSPSQTEGLNLTAVNTPDDWIKVVDGNNREVFRFPYDSNLMAHIESRQKSSPTSSTNLFSLRTNLNDILTR